MGPCNAEKAKQKGSKVAPDHAQILPQEPGNTATDLHAPPAHTSIADSSFGIRTTMAR